MSGVTSSDMTDEILQIGIILRGDTKLQEEKEHVLGFINLTDTNVTAANLRSTLSQQLHTYVQFAYIYLTQDGWPVNYDQESNIFAKNLITSSRAIHIKKKFDNCRVGICLETGKALGFVFIDRNSSVLNLRSCIECQLRQACPELSGSYRFLDANNWPVTSEQENQLNVFDVMKNSEVNVELLSNRKRKHIVNGHAGDQVDTTARRPKTLELSKHTNTRKTNNQASTTVSHQTSVSTNSSTTSSNPIFISYVRAEAADHAVDLKRVLSDHGVGVYLDVHEIKAGVDWQDSLNDALRSCQIFIALVTEMYGRTKWSNREVKAADMNNKVIVPISFLTEWPPDCLAIQFASTHYIPWKTEDQLKKEIAEGEESRARNTNFWDKQHINKVADTILEKYKDVLNSSVSSEIPESMNNPPSIVSETSGGFSPTVQSSTEMERPLIVISVHPKQKNIAHELRTMLSQEKYEVWCSTDTRDLAEQNGDVANLPSPITPTPVTTPNNPNLNFNSSGSNSSAGGDPQSVVSLFSRRNVKGLSWSPSIDGTISLSQMSDCSQLSMSPDKVNRSEIFLWRVKQASAVILLLSEDYILSRTSKKQAYYCEHRKKVIAVTHGEPNMSPCMRSLLDNIKVINITEEANLKQQIRLILKPATSLLPDEIAKEGRMALMVKRMMAALHEPLCNFVYVAGSSKFYNQKSESICHAIGVELANLDFVAMVTGGFFGVGDSVGRNFCEERQILRKEERIFHILPEKDSVEKYSEKSKMDDEGRFLPVPYGKTFFIGDSVQERECLVARLFNICILIEGGPGAAHEAEQFIWNDNIVIPVKITGGAAGGKFGIPPKVFLCPPGVSLKDWSMLSNDDVTPDTIALAIKKIVCSLNKGRGFPKPVNIKNTRKRKMRTNPLSRQKTVII